ncbi:MAG: DUF2332 domain-containing protein, partial [Micromonosporaceae bacterium]
MPGDEHGPAGTAAVYRRFAEWETRTSPSYQRWAYGVAGDSALLDLLQTLPPGKRQPNLFFAAARLVNGLAGDFAEFRRGVLNNPDAVLDVMRRRRTQTNEPARCGGMYPLLASLPQPLALLEVGASAGLCLMPDRYRYDYDGEVVGPDDSPVRINCRASGRSRHGLTPLQVAWRAGIDLNPLDVTSDDDVRWLETLVWPEHQERRDRLRAAIGIARQAPPRVVRGDLNERLAEVAAQAPRDATLVVFHTSVLWYLDPDARRRFISQVTSLPARWVSQEDLGVLPEVDAQLPAPRIDHQACVLALDQRPVAYTA